MKLLISIKHIALIVLMFIYQVLKKYFMPVFFITVSFWLVNFFGIRIVKQNIHALTVFHIVWSSLIVTLSVIPAYFGISKFIKNTNKAIVFSFLAVFIFTVISVNI